MSLAFVREKKTTDMMEKMDSCKGQFQQVDFSAESSVSPAKCCRAPADDNGARVSAIYSGTRVGVATPLPGRMYNCDWF